MSESLAVVRQALAVLADDLQLDTPHTAALFHLHRHLVIGKRPANTY